MFQDLPLQHPNRVRGKGDGVIYFWNSFSSWNRTCLRQKAQQIKAISKEGKNTFRSLFAPIMRWIQKREFALGRPIMFAIKFCNYFFKYSVKKLHESYARSVQ
jgi:hypothetical protein